MTALTADRATPERGSDDFSYPVAAAKTLYAGSLCVLDASGNCEPGTTATGKVAAGRCDKLADNSSGAAAAINAQIRAGTFRWENSSGDPVTKANIGDTVYIEDDQTVCATATGKSAAGVMVDIDSIGVWVETRPPVSLVSGLAAANNLSDLGSVATALANLGITDGTNSLQIDDLQVDGLATIAETLTVTGISNLNGGMELSASAAAGTMKQAVVAVSATEIRTMAASPKTLVAAQAGIAYVFHGALFKYTYVANVYDSVGAGEDLQIKYTDDSGQAVSPALDTTTDIDFGAAADDESWVPALATVVNPVTNAALVLDQIGAGELAAADLDANGDVVGGRIGDVFQVEREFLDLSPVGCAKIPFTDIALTTALLI